MFSYYLERRTNKKNQYIWIDLLLYCLTPELRYKKYFKNILPHETMFGIDFRNLDHVEIEFKFLFNDFKYDVVCIYSTYLNIIAHIDGNI